MYALLSMVHIMSKTKEKYLHPSSVFVKSDKCLGITKTYTFWAVLWERRLRTETIPRGTFYGDNQEEKNVA